jgi:tetratricopeptide (TPR) repeat protein
MMRRLSFLLFVLVGMWNASAQSILLKNGSTVPADGLVRDGDMLMVDVKTSTGSRGQVGYQVSDVAELNLPAPDILKYATEQMSNGDFAHALAQIDPLVTYQKTIRDIPGNWWAKSALVEVSALLGLNRTADATALVTEISNYSKDPEILVSAKLQIALTTKFTDPAQALAAYDSIISQSSDSQTLSRAWIAEGDIHVEQHEFDDALMNYLTVTVFYPEHNPLLPKALWGSGQAYAKIKDLTNAIKTYQKLVSDFPDTPEAALAKAELLKKENKT